MFHELRQEMGDEIFFEVLRIFESNKFQNAKPEDLYRACRDYEALDVFGNVAIR